MKNIFETLEKLSSDLMEKSNKAPTKAAALAYKDSSELLLQEIENITNQIRMDEEHKYEQQMKKFDKDHANYDILLSRGHVQTPSDIHAQISSFSKGEKTATEVFNVLSENYKNTVLSHVAGDKEMIEQLVAYRHGFDYITHTKGHDGIHKSGKVYEVKNKKYIKKARRLDPDIIFDRISPATARKLEEGRPTIIFNITDNAKLLVEMKIEFSDKLIDLYKNKVEELKHSKTSGFSIPFSDYKDDILEISYVVDNIGDYHIQKQFLDYLALAV